MPRISLPGGHAELLDVSALKASHQDEYGDLLDDLREKRLAALPPLEPDPANPAVMPDPADRTVRLRREDVRQLYDLMARWVVQEISFPGVLPWGPGSRDAMPLAAWNALRKAIDDLYIDALLGKAPDGKTETEPPSAPIFSATAPLQPESPPAPSGTAGGS